MYDTNSNGRISREERNAQHVPHRRLLPVVEPVAGNRLAGIAQRAETLAAIP